MLCYISGEQLITGHEGEFGVVYKGYIVKNQRAVTDIVAIKTLKGTNDISEQNLIIGL